MFPFPFEITDDPQLVRIAVAVGDDELAKHTVEQAQRRCELNPGVISFQAALGALHRALARLGPGPPEGNLAFGHRTTAAGDNTQLSKTWVICKRPKAPPTTPSLRLTRRSGSLLEPAPSGDAD